MFGFQAAGAAPLVHGEPVRDPDTVATAIRVGNPASWAGAIAARDESGGLIDAIPDERLLEAYHLLASREGVFVEPASAISVAGALATAADGRLPAGSLVVCTVTGHGLKDPDTALTQMAPVEPIPVSPGAVASALELT
jgi:threonine synthase